MLNSDEILNSINTKLNVVVNLLLKKEEMSVREKIAFMDGLSIPNKEACQLIGISETHYKSEKSRIKEKLKSGNSKKQTTDLTNVGGESSNANEQEQQQN